MPDNDNQMVQLATHVSEQASHDEHFRAVQAQVAFSRHIYKGILEVCSSQNGLAAEALLRTLFEIITSAIILAKHRDKLSDFVRHGRFSELRMMRVIQAPELQQRLAGMITATESEYQQLYTEFKEQRWHKLGTKDSFAEAEFDPGIYDRYYRRASAIAHGQPYETVRGGKVTARETAWKNLCSGAANMAGLMMLTVLSIVSREFRLGLEMEVNEAQRKLNARIAAHIAEIRKVAAIPEPKA